MKISYLITKEDYLETLILMLKEKRKTPVNVIIFLMMTVIQLSFAIWCAVKYGRSNNSIYILLALSIGICVLQIVYQLGIRLRAKTQMNRDIRKGNISPDFWSKQYISLSDRVFTLKCGKNELKYDCKYFSKAQTVGNILLLSFRKEKTVHQIMIPLAALESAVGTETFLNKLTEAKNDSIHPEADTTSGLRPESASYSVTFVYDINTFCRDQVRAARYAYTDRIGWTFSNIARLIAAAFLIYHIAAGSYESTSFLIFVVIIIALLIYPLIITFTPICRLLVKRNIKTLFGELDVLRCSLDISGDELYYVGDTFRNIIPLSQIYSVVAGARVTVIFLKDNTTITIPYSTSNNRETSRMALFLDTVADENWHSRTTREKLR